MYLILTVTAFYGHTHTHTHRATIKIKDFQVFYMKEIKYALYGDHMHASAHT